MDKAPRVAIDTEADSLYHYFHKVCLIQLTAEGEHFIVDPLAGLDLSPLLGLLARKKLIIHGADYDLRVMRASFGFRPKGDVFDTMLAATLLGYERFGLSSIVESFFKVHLTKKGQRYDWSKRPLSGKHLDYACEDTRYLEPLADRLTKELKNLGRLDWHSETCAAMVNNTDVDKDPPEPDDVWRIKGANGFEPLQLAYLREVWHWREKEARKADLPPFKIMGPQLLLKVAKRAAANGADQALQSIKTPITCSGRRLQALKKAMSRAQSLQKSKWPEKPKSSHVKRFVSPRVKLIRAERDRIAKELNLDPAVIAPRSAVDACACGKPATVNEVMKIAGLTRWQAKIMREAVKKVL